VTSPQSGAIAGAAVDAAGYTATTGAGGAYQIAGVPAGSRNVSVGNLPAGCAVPLPQVVTVTGGALTTANFSVSCPPLTGTLSGRVLSTPSNDPLWRATIVITPDGFGPLPPISSNNLAQWTASGVPVGNGSGTISIAPVQPWCTSPYVVTYSGLAPGGSLVVNANVPCARAPSVYVLRGQWSSITTGGPTGRRATLRLVVEMGSAPGRPDVNGAAADQFLGVRATLQGDPSMATFASFATLDPGFSASTVVPGPGAGVVQLDVASGNQTSRSGNVEVLALTFNIPAGVSGTLVLTSSISQLLADSYAFTVDPVASLSDNIPPLVIP
jgi:hypothetical protein